MVRVNSSNRILKEDLKLHFHLCVICGEIYKIFLVLLILELWSKLLVSLFLLKTFFIYYLF